MSLDIAMPEVRSAYDLTSENTSANLILEMPLFMGRYGCHSLASRPIGDLIKEGILSITSNDIEDPSNVFSKKRLLYSRSALAHHFERFNS
jgi:hypothetical protein